MWKEGATFSKLRDENTSSVGGVGVGGAGYIREGSFTSFQSLHCLLIIDRKSSGEFHRYGLDFVINQS